MSAAPAHPASPSSTNGHSPAAPLPCGPGPRPSGMTTSPPTASIRTTPGPPTAASSARPCREPKASRSAPADPGVHDAPAADAGPSWGRLPARPAVERQRASVDGRASRAIGQSSALVGERQRAGEWQRQRPGPEPGPSAPSPRPSQAPEPELVDAQPLAGKVGLVVGVANKRSISWAIAQAPRPMRARRSSLTFQNERLEENVRELAASLNEPLVLPCDVIERRGDWTRVFAAIDRALRAPRLRRARRAFADART